VFAAFAVWVWFKEVRKVLRETDTTAPVPVAVPTTPAPARPATTRTSRQPPRSGPAYDDSEDRELAAYNDYLAWLNANPNANPASYPGPARSEEKK
jgi:hypothetical protein